MKPKKKKKKRRREREIKGLFPTQTAKKVLIIKLF